MAEARATRERVVHVDLGLEPSVTARGQRRPILGLKLAGLDLEHLRGGEGERLATVRSATSVAR